MHYGPPRALAADEFPYAVEVVQNLFIPMSDGTRLSAKIWLPVGARKNPVPAILEYIPYRKRDATALIDSLMHGYFAGHGYASVRVDLRGTGDSDGLLLDEYLPREQLDCVEAVHWLAQQEWCSGSVGMIGISWGGFSCLQVAALNPKPLKAIITVCSTDDRFVEDVHYKGGALLTDNLRWGTTLLAFTSRPPDPQLCGEEWREKWMERLSHLNFYPAHWLEHQGRDDYWKNGSISVDYQAITCAVYAVGGWIDGYASAVFRLLENLSSPRKGLIGPWAHQYPMVASPGPRIGFLQESLRWWDKWLCGIENGIMEEPTVRAWMQHGTRPATLHQYLPGTWVSEKNWPSKNIRTANMWLDAGKLKLAPGAETTVPVSSAETVGLLSGIWCPWDINHDEPADQREEDAKSTSFDSDVLETPIDILGPPTVELTLACDQPQCKIAVRLCDVHPDGASYRVSYGVLNLSHRASLDTPEPLEPDRRYKIKVVLNATGYRFLPGHRIRLSLSTAYWPITWPNPRTTTLNIWCAESFVTLPVRPVEGCDQKLNAFAPPETYLVEEHTMLRAAQGERTIARNLNTGEHISTVLDDYGHYRVEATGIEISSIRRTQYRIQEYDPLSAYMESSWVIEIGRGRWRTRTVTKTRMKATSENFLLEADLEAFEDETRVFNNRWEAVVRRKFV